MRTVKVRFVVNERKQRAARILREWRTRRGRGISLAQRYQLHFLFYITHNYVYNPVG